MRNLKNLTVLSLLCLCFVSLPDKTFSQTEKSTAIEYDGGVSYTSSDPANTDLSSGQNKLGQTQQSSSSPSGWNVTDIAVTTSTSNIQSENSVFINPNNPLNLLNSNNSTNWPFLSNSDILGASYWVSFDGGQTWTGSVNGAGGTNKGDPATAIDLNGRFYIGYIAANRGQGVAFSPDQGLSWIHRQVGGAVFSPNGLDKNHLWVDNSASSAFEGNLYSSWLRIQSFHPNHLEIEIVRSTDDGINWSSPLNISSAVNAGSHNQGVNIQTGPNGEVYVIWAIYDTFTSILNNPLRDESALGFTKSIDGGVTFFPATRIISIKGLRGEALGGGKTMDRNGFPSMTVNQQTGKIYVVWANLGVPGVNTGDPDIYMITSTDGGTSWSSPDRVNQDAQGNGKDQWLPWITCDPVTGLLACIFYDSRNFAGNDRAETFVALSKDDGQTWTDFIVSDANWAADGLEGFARNYAGDYLAIASRENKVYPMWSDDRTGNMLAYISPIVVGRTIQVPGDMPTIQAAIDDANDWDTVLVAPGTYTGAGNVNLNLGSKEIVVMSSGGASLTIIDCQNSARGFVFSANNTEGQEVKGFTIKNGFSATGGGGIEIAGAQPNILDCVFESCSAPTGGAIRISSSNSINNPLIVGVTFITDTATSGDGGAIFVGDNASYIIGGCLFESNYATGRGGAIRIQGTGQNLRIDNTVFDANKSVGEGAAFSVDGTLTTFCNTFVNHIGTGGRPSVISIHGSAVVVLDRLNITDNNTFAVDKLSDASTLTFICNNLWQNGVANFNPNSVYQENHVNTGSDINNIFADPLYCDFANKNYSLSWLSPCDKSNTVCPTSIGRFAAACGPAPDLLSPADNSSTTDQSPFMDWSDVDIASGVAQTYEIEIDNVEFFISPDRTASNLIVSNWTVSPNLPYDNWFWRARAINTNPRHNGSTLDIAGDWSVVRTFEVVPPPPPPPSCPVLFTNDGSGYVEENPLLTACEESGYQDIVTDYYQLRTSPKVNNDRVTFQLRELEDEITFLDNIELLTIDHSVTTQVACDVNGNIFCYNGEQAVALSAIDQNGNDRLSEVVDEDGIFFNSTKSGSLTLTFPNNGQTGGYEFNTINKQPLFCLPDDPFGKPVTVDELEIPILKFEVLNQDGTWAEIQSVPSRINPVSEIVLIDLPELYASDIVTIRLSWEGSYSTDVIRQLIPNDEDPTVKIISIADYNLSMVDKGSNKWSGFGEDTPLILRKGDIFEFSFQVDELTGIELTRDFVIVATGRYEPDYEVYSQLLPTTVTLHRNYPNPFNPTTTISYSLPEASHVKLEIYNSLGQLVKTMVDGYKSAGHHQVEWKSLDNNGAGVASGVYFYRLVTDEFNESKKMLLLK